MPYVQRDSAGKVVGAFTNPQPGFATELVADTDAGYQSFLNPPVAQFAAKIAAGCQVVSTSRSYLNATYPIDAMMQQRSQAITDGINSAKGFPHGAATYNWPATPQVTFKATADAIDVFAALEAYVSDLILAEAAIATGNPATWPTLPVTIA